MKPDTSRSGFPYRIRDIAPTALATGIRSIALGSPRIYTTLRDITAPSMNVCEATDALISASDVSRNVNR